MAKEKKDKKVKKPNAFTRFFKKLGGAFKRIGLKIAGFFKGIISEIKKVTWPTKKQVLSNTLSVLAFCLVVGAVIWIADFCLQSLMSLITRLS